MSQCVILHVTDAHEWDTGVLFGPLKKIPERERSAVLQPSRQVAEIEAARLARKTGGVFAVLEVVGVVRMEAKPSHVTVGGEVAATSQAPTWLADLDL